MVDLFIDGDALAATRTTLENIRETLSGAAGAMSAVPGDVTGHDALRQQLSSFGEEWNHGIGELSEVSGNGAEGLAAIAQGFADLDAALKASIDGTGGEG
ncbi:hypothetical protein [Georgenia sp. Marseille-Q6866]